MRKVVLWIVGEPGVGKTSMVREMLGDLDDYQLTKKPKWTVSPDAKVVAAGHYAGEKFDGADRVPYNGVVAALESWISVIGPRAGLTIFDGDRFSNEKVVRWYEKHDVAMGCVLLVATPEIAAERRAWRGGGQNASWVKGRKTKSIRFTDYFEHQRVIDVSDIGPKSASRLSLGFFQFLQTA